MFLRYLFPKGPLTGSDQPPPPPPPGGGNPTRIILTPSTLNLVVGQTVPLTATVLDENNNVLSGFTVSFSSTDDTLATVSSAGLVTAVAAGSPTITASVSPAFTPWLSTSTNFTLVKQHDFANADLRQSGTGDTWLAGSGTSTGPTPPTSDPMVQGLDASAPKSPPGTCVVNYPAPSVTLPFTESSSGSLGGGTLETGGFGSKANVGLYIVYDVMLSANFQGHPTGSNKEFEVFPAGSGANIVFGFHGVAGADLGASCVINDASPDPRQGTYIGGNVSSAHRVRSRGAYHRVEWLIIMNTFDTSGNPNADGQAYGWVDGVLHAAFTDLQWLASGISRTLNDMKFNPIWGGLGGTLSARQQMIYDQVAVYTIPASLVVPTAQTTCTITTGGSAQSGFDPDSFPHSSTGLLFAYTDFRSAHVKSDAQNQTEWQFVGAHVDKVISGAEPTGGYPVGLIHGPYTLMCFVYSDGTNFGQIHTNADADYADYCAARSLDPELGYLHYAAGQEMFHDQMTTIDASGAATMVYDMQSYSPVYSIGDVVTVVGVQVPGTSVIINSITSGTPATVVTATAHGFSPGDTVAITTAGRPKWDGNHVVATVVSPTSFTIAEGIGSDTSKLGFVGRPSPINGTRTISAISVTSNPANPTGPAAVKISLAGLGGVTGAHGTIRRTPSGTKISRDRFRGLLVPFPPPRWFVNPGSPQMRQYQADRYTRILSNADNASSYVPEMAYVDEVTETRFNVVAAVPTVEYPLGNADTFYADIAGLFGAVHDALPQTPYVIEYGTASFTSARTIAMIKSGKGTQEEEIMNTRVAFNWPGSNMTFTQTNMANGAYCEVVTPYFPSDSVPGGGGCNYINDPVPIGMKNAGNVRNYASCFAVSLLCYDPVRFPQQLALNVWNGDWVTAGGVDDHKGLIDRWIQLFEVDFGFPVNTMSTMITGVNDPLGQSVAIYTRDFQRGKVVYRRDNKSGTNVCDATAGFQFTLPASSGPTGLYSRVKSDLTLDVPTLTFKLSVDEAVFLLPV